MRRMYRCCIRCQVVYGCCVFDQDRWLKCDCLICEKPCEFYRKKADDKEMPDMSHGLCDDCFLILKKERGKEWQNTRKKVAGITII